MYRVALTFSGAQHSKYPLSGTYTYTYTYTYVVPNISQQFIRPVLWQLHLHVICKKLYGHNVIGIAKKEARINSE
jgi:hypothetical protein